MDLQITERHFLPEQLSIQSFSDIEPFFKELTNRDITSLENLKKWLSDRSELDAVLEENMAWRYIRFSINTTDEELAKSYQLFVTEIQPHIAPYEDLLNKKLLASPARKELQGEEYKIYLRSIETSVKLFREENIELQSKISEKSQEFGSISGAQSIEFEGQQITMQKAATFLKDPDREKREKVFRLMADRRLLDVQKLDQLFSDLLKMRHQTAINAGFENFRDYMFEAMGRFDYTKEDCFNFHSTIASEIVPLVKAFQQEQCEKMGLKKMRPWDTDVDPEGRKPLKPFESGEEMLHGTINMFASIDPFFGECLHKMDKMGHLDLESKPGKSPGGYNYPLYETGVPFIFMNAVGTHRDLVTMVHEGGHAVHSFLSRDLPLTGFKSLPSEVAELASMSMELISMDQWHRFYASEEELKRAKKEQLQTVLQILPWIATIDEFQHRLYENPEHTEEQRTEIWLTLLNKYGTGMVDWSGFEATREKSWQRQLHLFEVPFYYIEYGIAQLGALGVWMNYKKDPIKAVEQYKSALALGYTRSIPAIYTTAGIRFDFSKENLRELVTFVKKELENLQ